jgi:DNA-binding NtrC family response regulator
LYFRIKTFQIELPKIENDQRKFLITLENIWSELKDKYHLPHVLLPCNVRDYLFQREWKGHFRELKNALEYALIFSNQREIKVENFPKEDVKRDVQELNLIEHLPDDYNGALEIFESQYLSYQLLKNAGRVNETAKKLGMSKTTLIHKARKYHINTLKIRAKASEASYLSVA